MPVVRGLESDSKSADGLPPPTRSDVESTDDVVNTGSRETN
jgi:hypothetical protein